MDTKEFDALKTNEERLEYVAAAVAFWRDKQRTLYRIGEAETGEEKAALAVKLTAAVVSVEPVIEDLTPIDVKTK